MPTLYTSDVDNEDPDGMGDWPTLTGYALPSMSGAPLAGAINAETGALPLGYVWVSNH